VKKKFKFNLGEKVFVVGRPGFCIVGGRGTLNFISGGSFNVYCIDGAIVSNCIPEYILQTVEERRVEIGK
jgi:hypothetical protein